MARKVLVILIIWLCLSLGVGVSGIFYKAPAPVIAGTAWSLVLIILLLFWRSVEFRRWFYRIDLRLPVLFHLTRFVGIWFLILHGRGRLPYAFAVPGGWGDILAATGAILIALLFLPIRNSLRWWVVFLWNTFGLLDILMVVSTGARLALANIDSMAELTAFPLNLLPLFVVPLIIATHILIFARLSQERRALKKIDL
jgi:hypothetical protein